MQLGPLPILSKIRPLGRDQVSRLQHPRLNLFFLSNPSQARARPRVRARIMRAREKLGLISPTRWDQLVPPGGTSGEWNETA